MSDIEDQISDAGDDLFGGDDDVDIDIDDHKVASDDEGAESEKDAASDREEYRSLRYESDDEDRRRDYDQEETKDQIVMDLTLYRHVLPKPGDNEFRSLRVPPFMKFVPHAYKSDTFEPTEWDIENAKGSRPKAVVRYRRDPVTGALESNAQLHRWSDGSITMSVGEEHYEIQRKDLAPLADAPYNEVKDAHYYAAAAHLSSNTLVIVGHVTEQFNVRPNQNVEDAGLALLKERMAKQRAVRSTQSIDDEAMKLTTVDPEQMKREAELAEKERAKAQRRREHQAAREYGYGRSGGNRGLNIGDLEGGSRRTGGTRKRNGPGAGRGRRDRGDYYSDEEEPAGGGGRGNNYEVDDFVVDSDEEEEVVLDDDDEEELLDEEEEYRPRRKRQKTVDAEDEDAEGEAEDEAPAHIEHARGRRRGVVSDDDDEED